MQQKSEQPILKVKRSKAGLGLFTLSDIKKGDFIIEYTGEHISNEEADRRAGKYLFILTKKITVDGRGRENIARYINHSCKPNAEAEIDDDALEIHIRARRNIKAGEELTYDYGKEYWDSHIKPHGCRCRTCGIKKLT
jgi:uncharacterized protein